MKVKDLRKILKDLPANMEIMVNTGISTCSEFSEGLKQNHYYGAKVKKAKVKLVRRSKTGDDLIQSRPQKDPKAKLFVILE